MVKNTKMFKSVWKLCFEQIIWNIPKCEFIYYRKM